MNALYAVIDAINSVLRPATVAVMGAFANMPPMVPLAVISAVLGVLAALAFKYTSNQAALKRVADRIRASLLAMRLYRDDTAVTFKAIGGLLGASLGRLWYSLSPMIVLIVPFVFIIAQLAMYYEFRPLRPGDKTLVEARVLPDQWDTLRDIRLTPPEGVSVLAKNRDEHTSSVWWVIRADKAIETSLLKFQVGGVRADKQLVVSDHPERLHYVSPMRAGPSFWDRLLYPGEPPFSPASAIQSIRVDYPPNSTPLLGWDVHWLITFLIVSIVGALIAKPFLKVQF